LSKRITFKKDLRDGPSNVAYRKFELLEWQHHINSGIVAGKSASPPEVIFSFEHTLVGEQYH